MVQPRVGRRKIVDTSSDDEDRTNFKSQEGNGNQAERFLRRNIGDHNLPNRTRTDSCAPVLSQAATSSPTPSPKATTKQRQTKLVRKDSTKKASTKSIYSFFNTTTQKLQQKPQNLQDQSSERKKEGDDAIQDDISDNDSKPGGSVASEISNITNSKKRIFSSLEPLQSKISQSPHPLQSQKFFKISDGSRAVSVDIEKFLPARHGLRPWPEEYAPTGLDELVIHKKKVSDVKQWLIAALAGQKYKRLLVLKGPAGCGKTVTLSLLAKVLGISINEWKNPAVSEFSSDDYLSISSQFDDFLGRGAHFGILHMINGDGIDNSATVIDTSGSLLHDRQIIVVEDFPYSLLRSTSSLQSFRSTLMQYLSQLPSTDNIKNIPPLVLIVSESELSRNAGSLENFSAHRLLGSEILHHPSTTLLEFNTVAPTFITRAINLVLQKHSRETGSRQAFHLDVIQRVSEIGDIRNAISALEFLSTQKNPEPNDLPKLVKNRLRDRKNEIAFQGTTAEATTGANSLLIGLRESTIGLFHAVGKVVYNKRCDQTTPSPSAVTSVDDESQLPTHLSHLDRPLPSEVNVTTLIDESGTDTSTFLSSLHENYALSCLDPKGNSETTLDVLNGCLSTLGDADILLNPTLASRSGANEGLRQDEIAFETGVRGLLFNLPNPVKRQERPGKGKADAHRMFYPTDLKIWREKEEISGLIDMFIERATQGSLLGGSDLYRVYRSTNSISQPGRFQSVAKMNTVAGFGAWRQDQSKNNSDLGNHIDTPSQYQLPLGSGHSARYEMVLERLPYLIRMLDANNPNPRHDLQKQIERVTCFTGLKALEGDEENEATESKHVHISSLKAPSVTAGFPRVYSKMKEEDIDVQGLVLSDDDIEDD